MELIEKGFEIKFLKEERNAFGEAHDYLCDLIATLKDKDLSIIFIPKQITIDIDDLEAVKLVLGKLYDYLIPWDAE